MGTGKGGKDKGGKGEDMGKDMGDKGEEVEAAWERATRLGDVNWDNWFDVYLHERRQCRCVASPRVRFQALGPLAVRGRAPREARLLG